jgi:hypothetical protein
MSNLRILPIILIFVFFTANISSSLTLRRRETYFLFYKQNRNLNRKIEAVYSLAKLKDIRALTMFVNDLCFPPYNRRMENYTSGISSAVRRAISIALRSYKGLNEELLIAHFNALRKFVEDASEEPLVGFTVVTLAMWSKGMGDKHKRLLVNSIKRRTGRVHPVNSWVVFQFVEALRIIKTNYALDTLSYMLTLGYSARIKARIKKVLNDAM